MNRKLKNEELDRPSLNEFKQLEKMGVSVVLDNIRSLNNIGSFFRTCDAFAVERIVLCGITAVPPHKDIHRTALGATESVEWEYAEDALGAVTELKGKGYKVIAIEQATQKTWLQDVTFETTEKCVLIFGNEVFGVTESLLRVADEIVEIPQSGTKHSLNVSVSAGIVLWEAYKQLMT